SSRRRHTIFSRDWSSDVCSSDLSIYNASLTGAWLTLNLVAIFDSISRSPGFKFPIKISSNICFATFSGSDSLKLSIIPFDIRITQNSLLSLMLYHFFKRFQLDFIEIKNLMSSYTHQVCCSQLC